MELIALYVALGGFIAGLVGYICFRLEARSNIRASRKALAGALIDDLRTSADLYTQLIEKWDEAKFVWFDLLEQIAFVRSNFNQDRPHFQILGDADIRTRLTTYFRESYVTLTKLRQKQQEIYAANEDDTESINRLHAEVGELLETLAMYRRHATEIADQLTLRF